LTWQKKPICSLNAYISSNSVFQGLAVLDFNVGLGNLWALQQRPAPLAWLKDRVLDLTAGVNLKMRMID
jgi:hypothetical protein